MLYISSRTNSNLNTSSFYLKAKHKGIAWYLFSLLLPIQLLLCSYQVCAFEAQSPPPHQKEQSTKFKQQRETLIDKANNYYQLKDYNNAITQYLESITFLLSDDEASQTKLGRVYTKIAESYKRLKNREKTAYYYKEALAVYSEINDKRHIARTLNTLAEAERYLGNLVVALNYSNRSLAVHAEIDDPEGRAKALMGSGIIYRSIGRYEKSLENIHEAHLYFKNVKSIKGIAKTSIQIGLIYTRLEQFDLAKSFYQLIIELPEEQVPPTELASALREMAVIDLEAGNFESAMLMVNKAHIIYQTENDKAKQSLTTRIIANIYREQLDNTNAKIYYRKSLSLANEVNSTQYQIKALTPLAAILITEDTDEAIKLAKHSLKLAKRINDKGQMLYAYRTIRQAEDSLKNYAEAISYAKKEISLAQVIQKEKDDNNLTLAKASLHSYKLETELVTLRKQLKFDQLEIAKRDNEIEIAEQSRKINELEIIKNKYANFALASLLIFCLFVVAFFYRRSIASKKINKELNYLASRDPLTNCYNRRTLFDLMNQYFANLEFGDEYCIIMADIDHFKSINDTHGHSVGDKVICGVANVLQSCIRQNDIVARFGGEEFCIVLHQVTKEQAMDIAETMRQMVENNHFDNVRVTSSFGVTSLQDEAISPSELIEQADVALYKSKSLGRNLVTLWDKSLNE